MYATEGNHAIQQALWAELVEAGPTDEDLVEIVRGGVNNPKCGANPLSIVALRCLMDKGSPTLRHSDIESYLWAMETPTYFREEVARYITRKFPTREHLETVLKHCKGDDFDPAVKAEVVSALAGLSSMRGLCELIKSISIRRPPTSTRPVGDIIAEISRYSPFE